MEGQARDFDINEGKVDRRITPADFNLLVNEDDNIAIVDVRRDDEREGGFIAGSIHKPSEDIIAGPEDVEHLLPENKETTILFHCATGGRASGVVEDIVGRGYENTYYLDGAPNFD